MKMILRRLPIFVVFAISLLWSSEALAVFDFSVSPRRGGQNLRFETGGPGGFLQNEEVTLTVETDLQTQYRIFQTLLEPLRNENGDTIPQGAFQFYSPSSPSGTLRTQTETPVMMGDMPLYTSNASGTSEAFVLVYNVNVPQSQAGGTYHTRLSFTAEPVNPAAGVSQRVVTLDVRLEVRSAFRLTVENSRGGRALDFKGSGQETSSPETLLVQIDNNAPGTVRLTQQLSEPLLSAAGEMLDFGAVAYSVSGSANAQWKPLDAAETPLYVSERGGPAALELHYALKAEEAPRAGVYSGNLIFKLESDSYALAPQIVNIPTRVEVEAVFDLEIKMEDNGGGLAFGTYKSGHEKQERGVYMRVRSNLGAPYQIMQRLARPLTNESGATIPERYFLYSASEAKSGVSAAPQPQPMLAGESPIFTSDKQGTPEELRLHYELSFPDEAKSGSYSSEITYSIISL